jgi:hypothetical protein
MGGEIECLSIWVVDWLVHGVFLGPSVVPHWLGKAQEVVKMDRLHCRVGSWAGLLPALPPENQPGGNDRRCELDDVQRFRSWSWA